MSEKPELQALHWFVINFYCYCVILPMTHWPHSPIFLFLSCQFVVLYTILWEVASDNGVRKGRLRLKPPPWAWYFTKTLLPLQRRLIVFAYLLLVNFSMQIPRNKFACKFQGTLLMDQKVTTRFWWESGLSSASRNHLTTFCRPFAHYAWLKLRSAIVRFIRNDYFVR